MPPNKFKWGFFIMEIKMTLKKSVCAAGAAAIAVVVSYLFVATMPDNFPIDGCGSYSWCYRASANAMQTFHGVGGFFAGLAALGLSVAAFVMWLDGK